jgi:hypothetical protein
MDIQKAPSAVFTPSDFSFPGNGITVADPAQGIFNTALFLLKYHIYITENTYNFILKEHWQVVLSLVTHNYSFQMLLSYFFIRQPG